MSNSNRKITALYCRLSQEDMRDGESLSIENQKIILQKYADDPKQLLPDPEAAPIIKRIFEMYANGIGIRKICSKLCEEQILSPSVYAFRKTGRKTRRLDMDRPYHWERGSVRFMLSNRIYCGDTVNFQTYSKSNKLKRRIKNDDENMLIFENTHEAIVDRKTFDLVQKHFEGRKRPSKHGDMDKYAGYIYCGDCGRRLYLHRNKTEEKNCFMCSGYQNRITDCTCHYIREQILEHIVLENLKTITAFARNDPEKFYAMAAKNGEAEARKFIKESKREKEQIDARITQLDSIIRCLYEDRVTGRITPERYDSLANDYEQEQSQLKSKLVELESQIDSVNLREECIRKFMSKAKEYIEMPKLTPELLRTFIRRIEVYEKSEKYSRTCGNTIAIHYTFEVETHQS